MELLKKHRYLLFVCFGLAVFVLFFMAISSLRAVESCVYSYSDWSTCNSAGTQTRTWLSKSPTGCYENTNPITSQTCSLTNTGTTVICSYTYGDWSACSSAGTQTRSVTKSPTGCHEYPAPIVNQTCVYSNTDTATTCSYTYGEWSACSSAGTQTRMVTKSPTNCREATSPVLSRTCDYVSVTITPTTTIAPTPNPTTTANVSCSYAYGDWSTCGSTGTQTRTWLSKSPTGCSETAAPILKRDCSFLATTSPALSAAASCSYDYSDWAACDSSGKQTRMIKSKFPDDCHENVLPVIERTCYYESPKKVIVTPICSYTYRDWSACGSSGVQTRVADKSSQGCYEAANPLLTQSCRYSPPAASNDDFENLKSSPPPPAPESILTEIKPVIAATPAIAGNAPVDAATPVVTNSEPVVIGPQNLNERTAASWQEFYFKFVNCADAKTCGGSADPDQDGLTNNEEYRYGTNPRSIDSDKDGYPDAVEIQNGFNPLVASSSRATDKIIFEDASAKGAGVVVKEVYQVNQAEMVQIESQGKPKKYLRISGKALPNIFVVIYIYSDPIVLTVKTDADGNWSYVLDKTIDDGQHQVYVAVTDNTGKVTAKSEPLTFLKTAQAISVVPPILPAEAAAVDRTASPSKNWLMGDYIIFIGLGLIAMILALAAVGLVKLTSGGKWEN